MTRFRSHFEPGFDHLPISILLVEDDDGDAKALYRAFRKAGIADGITRAKDGIDALEILREKFSEGAPPFILIADVNMPRLDGHGLVRAIRDDPDLRSLVIFMLTTSRAREDIDGAYEGNVAGYIVKENAGDEFTQLLDLLGSYWRVVELPDPREMRSGAMRS